MMRALVASASWLAAQLGLLDGMENHGANVD